MLIAFEQLGIKETIRLCVGMFSFAVWDQIEKVLIIGRDRMGEKPIYYGWQGLGENECFLFGSEIDGLPKEILKKFENRSLKIPMVENSRSINLSNSVAIIIYEAWRQLKFSGAYL